MVVLAAAALQYSYTLGENITRFFNTVSGVIVEINDVIANVAVRLLRIDFGTYCQCYVVIYSGHGYR